MLNLCCSQSYIRPHALSDDDAYVNSDKLAYIRADQRADVPADVVAYQLAIFAAYGHTHVDTDRVSDFCTHTVPKLE